MADARKKQLVFNIIEFLRTSAQDGTVKEDDKESLEVAVQCIAESFGVDPDSSEDQKSYSIAPASLLSILDVFLKTKAKSAPSIAPSAAGHSETKVPSEPTAEDKKQAEALKTKGNSLMSSKLYDSAIEQYTQAIALYPNPVYYSNRAAAWGGLGKHEKAIEDAEKALDLDPNFSKAYSRLGHAHFSTGDYPSAVRAYEDGLKLDPSNSNMKTALATAKSKLAESSTNSVADREPPAGGAGAGGMPDLSSLASMLGGAGGGNGGGMPDLASMMRNPQLMAMAQQMMANGGLERLMQNPALRNMAENMQNGGGMPDMSQLANDPSMRDLAQQFMGGQGQGQGRGA
ncbi:cytoplasmic protein [Kwoniella mangroviensis CBS 10435]|uniref:Cytoplasmic protein n=1 Tax=Kwoniella mangroviensis CBS 10435 TaxID=1331196 RepID=A0A1B9IYX9_9TREE|nr:cytoplasmic protein [Kwoniella mangroviensis CBS 10435]